MDLVESVLKAEAEKEALYKTTEVTKAIDLDIDEGNLLASDSNPIDDGSFRSNREQFILDLARDNAQLLVNKIWELPVDKVDGAVTGRLPDTTTIIPREKSIPKPKSATKWQEFAQLKSIQNKKKGRKVWDDETKEWKPRWGYKRANDETKQWAIEVPQNADPYEDQFEKLSKAKKERAAKNELQRLRNIGRKMKGKVPGVGLTPTEAPDKDHMSRALSAARSADASVGKFSRTLPKEKPMKNSGKRRKFESNIGDFKAEKKRSLDILSRLNSNKDVLNVKQATNQVLLSEDNTRAEQKGKRLKAGKRNTVPRRSKAGQSQGKGKKGGKRNK